MHRVRMLIYFGVTPYLVFDGDNLPSKAGTENERAKRREESKRRGLEFYKASKVSQAYLEFQKAVDVTPTMARQLIEELKKLNIQYVVAPYEADAQLAYLEKKGIIDGILSEDSDLLVYGAKRLMTKLDQHGDCIEISRSDFASCRDLTLAGFTDADFRCMAILSGCDYLPSINKIGLKTAHTYVRKFKKIEKIVRILQFEEKFVVPDGYLKQFYAAERTFLHHRVFCPLEKKLVLFTDLEHGLKEDDMPYLGENISPATAIGVACGDLDPITKKQLPVNITGSSRSMPDLYRRQTLASTHDLKPSKSIDNFFKSKREPLAELDPNSLTPSPSQQRLLHLHRNASWETRPVSSAPQLRRSTRTVADAGHGQVAQTQSSERLLFLEKAATLSTFQPSKRTRLCSDAGLSPSGKDSRSHFFAPKPEPSPSIRKGGKTKKARLSDIEIFSDDSVADVFQDIQGSQAGSLDRSNSPAEQADRSNRNTSKKSSAIDELPVTNSCDTPIRQTIHVAKSVATQTSLAISVSANDNPEEFEDLVETHVKKLNSLRNTFTYQPLEKQAVALQGLETPKDTRQPARKEDMEAEKRSSQGSNVRRSPEVARPYLSRRTPSLQKTFGAQPSDKQAAALDSLAQTQSSTQKVKLGLAALGSAGSHETAQRSLTPLQQLEQRALHKPRALKYTRERSFPISLTITRDAVAESEPPVDRVPEVSVVGSEDLLAPDSEDEASELSEMDNDPSVTRNIDLTRFAFSAKA